MKIIDEKGRLFGKINVIDFFVILFLLCFIPMFYFGYKIFTKEPLPVTKEEEFKEFITLKDCKFIKIKPEVLRSISVGDKEINENGEIIGKIIWVGENKPFQYKYNMGTDKEFIKESPDFREAPVILDLKVSLKGDGLYYNNQRISYNSPPKFKTDKYVVEFMPVPEVKLEDKGETKILDLACVFKDLTEDTLKLISVGDKFIDEKGEVLAEILEIGKVENNKYNINLSGGYYTTAEDYNKKQLNVKLRLKCDFKKDDTIYFLGQRLSSDYEFKLSFERYQVLAKLAQVYEEVRPILEKWVKIQVKFNGVIPELAKAISDGDVEKEPSGKTVGILRKILINKNAEIYILRDYKLVDISHPLQRDLTVSLEILCSEKEGTLYFKNSPIKIGNIITFSTDLYSISGIIINLS